MCSAISLLEALHPTLRWAAADAAAAEWIAQHESGARGCIRGRSAGWTQRETRVSWSLSVRTRGNGHAHVFTALVSCSKSQAQAEYEETSLKQLPMLRALGLANTRSSQSVSSELPPQAWRARALLEGLRVSEHA